MKQAQISRNNFFIPQQPRPWEYEDFLLDSLYYKLHELSLFITSELERVLIATIDPPKVKIIHEK